MQLLKLFNDLIVTQDEDFAGGCSTQLGVATNGTIQIITTYLDIIIILSSVVIVFIGSSLTNADRFLYSLCVVLLYLNLI